MAQRRENSIGSPWRPCEGSHSEVSGRVIFFGNSNKKLEILPVVFDWANTGPVTLACALENKSIAPNPLDRIKNSLTTKYFIF